MSLNPKQREEEGAVCLILQKEMEKTGEADKVSKHKRIKKDVCFLPSLLLVTGMLWTVRSLKQELVRTWSSTELNTHAWRSEKHTTTTQF